MSANDDTCDFCRSYVDPIGGDLKQLTSKGFWCGVCQEGRNALWGDMPNEAIMAYRDELTQEYRRHPIDWSNYPEEKTPEGYQAHLRRLDLLDTINNLNQVLKDRGETVRPEDYVR